MKENPPLILKFGTSDFEASYWLHNLRVLTGQQFYKLLEHIFCCKMMRFASCQLQVI